MVLGRNNEEKTKKRRNINNRGIVNGNGALLTVVEIGGVSLEWRERVSFLFVFARAPASTSQFRINFYGSEREFGIHAGHRYIL